VPLRTLISTDAYRLLTRRQMLERTMAGAVGAAQLACGGGEQPIRERNLAVYSWAEYHAPENVRSFASAQGVSVSFDFFDSNEAMLAKLELAGASSGYDLVVPNIEFVPLLVQKGLLQPLDRARIPNWTNQDPKVLALKDARGGDPDGRYAAIKDWGTTGFVYDRKVVPGALTGWADFARAAAKPGVSGRVSVLPSPLELLGVVMWRDEASATDLRPEALVKVERTLLDEIAPHVKAFDGYPALGLLGGDYSLAQCWNGDARKAIAEDPDRFRWVLGAPRTNMWIATWVVTASCAHLESAHAFINYMLDPQVSAREIEFTGNDTAVLGADKFLPADLPARDLIFFSEEQRARLIPSILSDAQPRLVEIYNKVKLAASRA
jgi:spermidine/putrescine transport system substrate-binding protein